MVAVLPAVFSVAYGDAPSPSQTADFEDILIGAKNVSIMDRIGRERVFADKEVPQATLLAAQAAARRVLAALPAEEVEAAKRLRCRRLLNEAAAGIDAGDGLYSMEDMRERANSPVCAIGM